MRRQVMPRVVSMGPLHRVHGVLAHRLLTTFPRDAVHGTLSTHAMNCACGCIDQPALQWPQWSGDSLRARRSNHRNHSQGSIACLYASEVSSSCLAVHSLKGEGTMLNSSADALSRSGAVLSSHPSLEQKRSSSRETIAMEKLSSGGFVPLSRMRKALEFLRSVPSVAEPKGNKEMQMQLMLTFLYIAERHPNPVPSAEIEKNLVIAQTTVSRNLMYLATGARDPGGLLGGYKLVETEEDPYYRKRKLTKLTKKGEDIAAKLAAILQG